MQLYHNSAPAHSVHLIQAYLAKNKTPLVQHPPYSPAIPPCNSWLLTKLKIENKPEREVLWFERGNCLKNNSKALYHSNFSILEMLQVVSVSLGELFVLQRGSIWRWLNKICEMYNIFFFFINQGWILCEWTSFIYSLFYFVS